MPGFFIAGLIISGVTAFPLLSELIVRSFGGGGFPFLWHCSHLTRHLARAEDRAR